MPDFGGLADRPVSVGGKGMPAYVIDWLVGRVSCLGTHDANKQNDGNGKAAKGADRVQGDGDDIGQTQEACDGPFAEGKNDLEFAGNKHCDGYGSDNVP